MPLFVVATPLGNLDDLSPRAAETLRSVDVVFAEDTRHSRRLLDHVGSRAPCRSLHEHNEASRSTYVIELLQEGQRIALISDAGTPAISDPGAFVVRAVRDAGLPVIPIPGPSAVVAFLSACGLQTDAFNFVGFPPRKSGARSEALTTWLSDSPTTVLYESPNRVLALLEAIVELAPNRRLAAARELTKMHEQWYIGTAQEVLAELSAQDQVRGEFVLGFDGAPADAAKADEAEVEHLIALLCATGARTKEIAAVVSDLHGVPRAEAYQRVLEVRSEK
jgi:16S rRNA (cytidine1402-2'-O)-methyltransferase